MIRTSREKKAVKKKKKNIKSNWPFLAERLGRSRLLESALPLLRHSCWIHVTRVLLHMKHTARDSVYVNPH